jgi:flagellar basal body-associated protein FliL
MMCIKPEHLGDSCDEVSEQKQEEEEKLSSWIIVLIIVASIVVLLSAFIVIVVMIVITRTRHAKADPSSGRTNPEFAVQVGVVGHPVNDTETATKA